MALPKRPPLPALPPIPPLEPLDRILDRFADAFGTLCTSTSDTFDTSDMFAPLSLERITRILGRIRYKPCWSFAAERNTHGCVRLIYGVPTYERETMRSQLFSFSFIYNYFVSEEQLISTVFANILALEDHEARELFLYDGDRLYDPHKEAAR